MTNQMELVIVPRRSGRTIAVRLAQPLPCPRCGHCLRAFDFDVGANPITLDCRACSARVIEISCE